MEIVLRITKSFTFDAAHWLPNVPEGHKCKRLHGHTYGVTLAVEGPVDHAMGWVLDYGEIKAAFAPLLKKLDHHCLNEIEGLENPTAEVLAGWIYRELKPVLPLLDEVAVRETPTTEAVFRP